MQDFSPELNFLDKHVCFTEHCISLSLLLLLWLVSLLVGFRAHNERAQISEYLSPAEWLWPRVEITPRGEVHPGHPQPLAFMKKRKHLFVSGSRFPPFWNCACRLIKLSLTGKTHSTQKINTRLFVIFFLTVLEYVFWWSVCLHYEGKWWGVSYYTPLAGMGFYFPEEYPCSVKTLIKNLQRVVKGLVCVAAAVTTVIFPLQKLTSKQQQSFTGDHQTFIVPLCTSRLRLARMMDSNFGCSSSLITTVASCYLFGYVNWGFLFINFFDQNIDRKSVV